MIEELYHNDSMMSTPFYKKVGIFLGAVESKIIHLVRSRWTMRRQTLLGVRSLKPCGSKGLTPGMVCQVGHG